jgi:hypothetical protein
VTAGRVWVIVAIVTALEPSGRAAPTPDHLHCYRVKDAAPRASYSADLSGLVPGGSGCAIKVPGALLCIEATKTNLSPPPQVEGSAPPAGRFLCYKVRCPRAALSSIPWTDQFGTRMLTPKVSKLVCAPELTVATTTTTTSTASTSTIPGSPCTVETAACTGSCGTGVCGVHCGVSGLVCASNGAGSCDTSVTCASDGDCAPGKICLSSPGVACSEAFCCNPCP